MGRILCETFGDARLHWLTDRRTDGSDADAGGTVAATQRPAGSDATAGVLKMADKLSLSELVRLDDAERLSGDDQAGGEEWGMTTEIPATQVRMTTSTVFTQERVH